VKESDTAFHAGVIVRPVWNGLRKTPSGVFVNPNSYTIGIEHEGKPYDDWTDAMYASSAALLRSISARYPALRTLNRNNVIMHREIRADKTWPGFKIDMDRLIKEASASDEPGV
jgi:N-acetyl-anhydromuramyl-L-alanine amidase AmpD